MVAKRKKTEEVDSGDTSNAPTQIGGGETSNPSTQIEMGVGEAMNPLFPREIGGETPNPPNPRDIEETSNPPSQREIGGREDSNPPPPREETGRGRETVTIDTDLLDCSICTNPLCPPLYQCMNGHVACPSCWSEIQHKCHICNVAVVTRNIALEKVLESVHLPCTYTGLGCPKSVSYSQRQVHTDTCEFGLSLCPIPGCLYKAFSGEWRAHFLKDHRWPGCDYDYGDSCNIQFDKEVDLCYTLLGPGKDLFLLVKESILNVGYTITLYYIDLTHQGQNVFPYELEVAIIRNGTQRLMKFHTEAVSIKEWKRGEERVGSFLILLQWQSPKIQLLIYNGYESSDEELDTNSSD